MEELNYYQILEIEENASEREIRKAYRELALKWHPDKHPDEKEKAMEKFIEIKEAYEILGDIEKRSEYDAELSKIRMPHEKSSKKNEEKPQNKPRRRQSRDAQEREEAFKQAEELLKKVNTALENAQIFGDELLKEAAEGNWTHFESLIAKGAGLSSSDVQGTVLHHAVLQNDFEMVQKILNVGGFFGASINSQNTLGHTPLHLAVLRGQLNIIRALLHAGAKLSYQDKRGRTPLHVAIYMASKKPDQAELYNRIAGMLISNGKKEGFWMFAQESNEISSESYGTPLYYALQCGNYFLVAKLFHAGVKIDKESEEMLYPVYRETENPHVASLMQDMIRQVEELKRQELEAQKSSWCPTM